MKVYPEIPNVISQPIIVISQPLFVLSPPVNPNLPKHDKLIYLTYGN